MCMCTHTCLSLASNMPIAMQVDCRNDVNMQCPLVVWSLTPCWQLPAHWVLQRKWREWGKWSKGRGRRLGEGGCVHYMSCLFCLGVHGHSWTLKFTLRLHTHTHTHTHTYTGTEWEIQSSLLIGRPTLTLMLHRQQVASIIGKSKENNKQK